MDSNIPFILLPQEGSDLTLHAFCPHDSCKRAICSIITSTPGITLPSFSETNSMTSLDRGARLGLSLGASCG